jgi:hypothetical protein
MTDQRRPVFAIRRRVATDRPNASLWMVKESSLRASP